MTDAAMKEHTEKYFGMTVEALEEIINRRVAEGWIWHDVRHNKPDCQSEKNMLLPPWGDKRAMWCAEWIEYKPGHLVPHWVARED